MIGDNGSGIETLTRHEIGSSYAIGLPYNRFSK